MGRLIVLILAVVLTTAGYCLGIWLGQPILEKAKASTEWPITQGTVIESRLESRRRDRKTTYSAHVVYKYVLDSEEFESERVWFGGDYSTSDRSEMQQVVTKYPVGQQVTVYYSPTEPGEAVLEPGAFVSSYLLFVIGLVLMGIGLILLVGLILQFAFGIFQAPATSEGFDAAAFADPRFKDDGRSGNSNDDFGPPAFDDDGR